MKWLRRLIVVLLGLVALLLLAPAIVTLFLPKVKQASAAPRAIPGVLDSIAGFGPVRNLDDWQSRRATLLNILEKEVYGARPLETMPSIKSRTVIASEAFHGKGRIEELRLDLGLENRSLSVVLAVPQGDGPFPLFLAQIFSGNDAVIPDYPVSDTQTSEPPGMLNPLIRFYISLVFGKHIFGPPVEKILERGYAVAWFHPGQVVPDRAGLAEPILNQLTPTGTEQRTGAIAAWAWAYSRVIDVLEKDPRIDAEAIIAWGHSRHGKSALLAAAYDRRIDFVISHQSGTGGASLNRYKVGESVGSITDSYPHWFAPNYGARTGKQETLTLDQHFLLALCAPTPLLLGNADRDQWSDPAGAFAAAQAAGPVWQLYGKPGMTQENMRDTDFNSSISFQLRPGRHGVTTEDWNLFLDAADSVVKLK